MVSLLFPLHSSLNTGTVYHFISGFQGTNTPKKNRRRTYGDPKLLINGGEQDYLYISDGKQQTIELLKWKLPRTRWIANTSPAGWIAGCPERQQIVYRHWFSFTRNPQCCSLWLAMLMMLTLLICICPAQSDLSFPVPTSSKVMSILYPTHTPALNPNDPLFISIGGEAMLQFSFHPLSTSIFVV